MRMNVPMTNELSHTAPVVKTRKGKSRGPLVVMALGAVLVVGHNFVQDYAQALASPDGLYIPEARHVVPPGTPAGSYSHTFRIYNARPWSVAVEAEADCGCTGLSWTRTRLLPLGWADVTASMKESSAATGSSSVSITFATSSSLRPYVFAFMNT